MPVGTGHLKDSGKTVIDALVGCAEPAQSRASADGRKTSWPGDEVKPIPRRSIAMRGGPLAAAMASVAVMMITSAADAAISFDLAPVDNSAVLTGYVTYDMQVTSDTDWTAAAGLLELTAGSIYQNGFGGDNGPSHLLLIETYPDLEFDTYIIGNIAGGGGDVGGTGYAFDGGRLDVSWYNLVPDEIGTTTIGRLTLTDDTAGNLSIMLTSDGDGPAEFDVAISPGAAPLVSQVIEEESAGSAWETSDRLTYTSPTAWVLPDGTRFFTLGPPPAGYEDMAVPAPDYRQLLYGQNLLLDPEHREALRDQSYDGYFKSRWVLDDPSGIDSLSESTLPEPTTLLLIGTCLGAAVLRRC
jgi:hypothetical protein